MSRQRGMPEGKIENVQLDELQIDESYQRGDKLHIRHIAGELFDPSAVSTLTVGRRAHGDLWVIDGRQRRKALMIRGYKHWKALVIHSTGPEYEALIYKLINDPKGKKALSSKDLFRAKIVATDPTALAVVRACEAAGLKCGYMAGDGKSWPEIRCVGALSSAMDTYHEESVTRALTLIAKIWYGQTLAVKELIPTAMCQFIGTYGDQIDDARLVRQLSNTPANKLVADSVAAVSGSRYARCIQILVELYNKRLSESKQLSLPAGRGRKTKEPDNDPGQQQES